MVGRLCGHVINLKRRPDRREQFLRWNDGHAVDWVWHDAVDADAVDRADPLLAGANDEVSDGELATLLSHRRQWLACVESGETRLIFEDDVCLRHGCEPLVQAALSLLENVDMLFIGYNADSPLALEMPDRLFAHMTLGNSSHASPGYFDHFARQALPIAPPHLHRALLVWGLPAYALTPRGAARLLNYCFPLRPRMVTFYLPERRMETCTVDGLVNAAFQANHITALACFPPLAMGPNNDSDVHAFKNKRKVPR